ncbi:unnamed protein product [Brassica oleracea]
MGVYILHLGVKVIPAKPSKKKFDYVLHTSESEPWHLNHLMALLFHPLPLVVLLLIAIRHAIFEVSKFICFMVKLDIFLQICQRES